MHFASRIIIEDFLHEDALWIFFLENLRRSVDFLFGRKSHRAYSAAYYAAPTIPETNHEHDVEFAGSQRGRCATNCLFEAAILMNCFDLFARARDTSCPPPIFFELS